MMSPPTQQQALLRQITLTLSSGRVALQVAGSPF